jgi:hypothetical protein
MTIITSNYIGRFLRGVSSKMVKLTYKKPKMAKVSSPKMTSLKVPHFPTHVGKLVVKTPKIKVPRVKTPMPKPIRVKKSRVA